MKKSIIAFVYIAIYIYKVWDADLSVQRKSRVSDGGVYNKYNYVHIILSWYSGKSNFLLQCRLMDLIQLLVTKIKLKLVSQVNFLSTCYPSDIL